MKLTRFATASLLVLIAAAVPHDQLGLSLKTAKPWRYSSSKSSSSPTSINKCAWTTVGGVTSRPATAEECSNVLDEVGNKRCTPFVATCKHATKSMPPIAAQCLSESDSRHSFCTYARNDTVFSELALSPKFGQICSTGLRDVPLNEKKENCKARQLTPEFKAQAEAILGADVVEAKSQCVFCTKEGTNREGNTVTSTFCHAENCKYGAIEG